MNFKFIVAIIVVTVVWLFGDFLTYGWQLPPDNIDWRQTPQMANPDLYKVWMAFAHAILATAFVWIYSRSKQKRPSFMQGLYYGLAVSMLISVPTALMFYSVHQISADLALLKIKHDAFCAITMGVVVAWLYRQPASAG
jgi:hypothetical protein